MSHPYKSSPQKMTHHVVAVGVFFGLITFFTVIFVAFCAYPHAAWDFQAGPYQKKQKLHLFQSFVDTYFNKTRLFAMLCAQCNPNLPPFACFLTAPRKTQCFRQIKVQKHRRQNCKCSRHGERPVFVRAPSVATA